MFLKVVRLILLISIMPLCVVMIVALSRQYPASQLIVPPLTNTATVVLIGDTQRTLWAEFWREQNDSVRPLIFSQLCAVGPTAIIHLGDAVAQGASEGDWVIYDSLSRCIKAASIPLYGVMGNHEYFGSNDAGIRNATHRFTNLHSEQLWSFTIIDSVAFLLLNSNFDELNEYEVKRQSQWLDSMIQVIDRRTDILVAVACWHHPPYTNSSVVSDDKEVQEHFVVPLRKCTKLKMVATGHAHTYEHFHKDGIDYLVSGGGGGARQELLAPHDARHKCSSAERSHSNLQRICNFHFCTVSRVGNNLSVSMNALDALTSTWSVHDTWTTK